MIPNFCQRCGAAKVQKFRIIGTTFYIIEYCPQCNPLKRKSKPKKKK